ncbi:MAG TPA: glutamate formimidoyltransferase [Thermoleophilia bacterium]|nr:glutamate formimidoyltransferase [Thermoleophilia bacterium]
MQVLECVPNISEGRDLARVEQVVEQIRRAPGVELLDYSSDADHNRSVITYVGPPEAVLEATVALCRKAYELIDMRGHEGGHPRMGAVDVAPFIPLRGISTEEAVELARRLGHAIGELGVPVYYYENAATRPERRNLADVRRGEYEALPEKLAAAEWAPDAGPAEFNEKSGATAVGVRFPLIAFNVDLATTDVEVARRIANAVRAKTGGYVNVKAMGLGLEEKGQVQVSMNLVQYEETPIHRVVETVRFEAARHGVGVAGCELIGLAPLAAFEEVIRHYLQIHDFSLEQIIETRLLEGLGRELEARGSRTGGNEPSEAAPRH